jgi:ABC-type amino acid transport substrate-binding protein
MWIWKILVAVSISILLASCSNRVDLTQEELDFVTEHTVIWAAEDNSSPLIFVNPQGEPDGISKDYLDLITKKTGLRFKMVLRGQLMDELNSLKLGSVELVTSVRPTPDRAEYASFTRPYVFAETVMMKGVNHPKTVGIGRGYAVKNYLEIERKDLKIVEFSNDEEAFRALQLGEIDSVVVDSISAKSLIKRYRAMYDTIIIPYEYPLSFAVRKDNTLLRAVLDKALSSITPEEHEAIRKKWM